MKRLAVLVFGVAWGATAANAADTASGYGALALAALVGAHAPGLTVLEKHALSSMLDGNLAFTVPAGQKIRVAADSVSCRSSNVDISEHDCTLKFGAASLTLNGRAAHELFATLIENGVPSDGAAGSIYEAVSHLSCTIDPAEVKQRGGGGADCSYDAGPGS